MDTNLMDMTHDSGDPVIHGGQVRRNDTVLGKPHIIHSAPSMRENRRLVSHIDHGGVIKTVLNP